MMGDKIPLCHWCGNVVPTIRGESKTCSTKCSKARRNYFLRIVQKIGIEKLSPLKPTPWQIFERSKWRCYLCGRQAFQGLHGDNLPSKATVDHIRPLSKGGKHSFDNCRCACLQCNRKKADGIEVFEQKRSKKKQGAKK